MGKKQRNHWHPTSGSDRSDMPQCQWCVKYAIHAANSLLCCVHRVGSYQLYMKNGRLTIRFGRAAGNIWASPWSQWHDTPGSEAPRQSSEHSASHWLQASLTGQAWLHSSHLQHKQVMTSRSRHWLPQPTWIMGVADAQTRVLFCVFSPHIGRSVSRTLGISIRKSVHINPSFN